MGREDDLSQKKSTIPKLNVIFFILVVRVSSQNFKIGPLQDFEKMRFWPILGLFLILGHFRAVFGPFFGGVQIFWSLNIIEGDHRPILFFIVFHFWAILGHFCQFWAVFHFGAFLHFRVVRVARGGVRGVRGGL